MRYVKWVLRGLWAGWKEFAHRLGVVNRYILLTVFYWVVIDVTNIGIRLLRVDLLDRRMKPAETYWHKRTTQSTTHKHQF